MDSRCHLCRKRSGEICRTYYFIHLIAKHLNTIVDKSLCICESCGQVLRHWDEFSADTHENLSRKITEPDSCQPDWFEGKSCDQQTQTDFECVFESTIHDHSYAKAPKQVEDESCQVDSSGLKEESVENEHFIHDFGDNNFFFERPDSDIKILDVCVLKDEQWNDDGSHMRTKEDCEYDAEPGVKIKEEPQDYDEFDNDWPDDDHPSAWEEASRFLPQTQADAPQVFRMDHHPIKEMAQVLVPNLPETEDCTLKPGVIKEEVKGELTRSANLTPVPLPPIQLAPNLHCCPICSLEFSSNDLLVMHLRSHENYFKPALNLACPDCNQEFLSEYILIEHIMEYHFYPNEKGEVACVICNQLQCSGSALRKHIFNCHFNTNPHPTHSSGAVSTEIAKKKTAPAEEEVKKVTTFSCKLCNVKLASKARLQQHVEQKHKGKKIVMKKAHENTKEVTSKLSKNIVRKGLKLHSERNSRFYCKLCMKSFPSARGAAIHITMVHKQQYNVAPKTAETATKGPFPCKKCNKVFVYLKRYKSHVCLPPVSQSEKTMPSLTLSDNYQKLSNGNYQCKLCNKRLVSYSGIVKHLRKCHLKECKIKQESEPQTPIVEAQKHTEPTAEFTCSREVRALKETQPFKSCDDFSPKLPPRDKTYTSMKRRQQMFACEDCSRHFLTKRQLRIHRKKLCKTTRATLAPMAKYCLKRRDHYLCNMCYKTDNEFEFPSEDDVVLHLDIDHNLTLQSVVVMQFVCKFCNQTYKCRAYLKTHIKQKHKDELEESLKVPAKPTEKDKTATSADENTEKTVKGDKEEAAKSSPPSPVKMYKCLTCGKLLPLQIALQRHMKIKHPPAPIIKTEPREEEEKPADVCPDPPSPSAVSVNCNECKVCGKVFKLSIALQKHMASHSETPTPPSANPVPAIKQELVTAEKPSSTSLPTEPAPLIKQELVPAENLPLSDAFKCQICGKAFADGEQLVAHSKNHFLPRMGADEKKGSKTNPPPKKGLLTCDLCDKGLSFFSQIALDQHKRKFHKPT